jgi:hypothetical protein
MTFRDLVISYARAPTSDAIGDIEAAIVGAAIFVRVVGAPPATQGAVVTSTKKAPLRIKNVRLEDGKVMIAGSAVPPRVVAAEETLATLRGRELLSLVIKTGADGLLVSAEDESHSWVALTRERVEAIIRRFAS